MTTFCGVKIKARDEIVLNGVRVAFVDNRAATAIAKHTGIELPRAGAVTACPRQIIQPVKSPPGWFQIIRLDGAEFAGARGRRPRRARRSKR